MLRNRAKRKYGTVAQKIQFLGFYRTAIIPKKSHEHGAGAFSIFVGFIVLFVLVSSYFLWGTLVVCSCCTMLSAHCSKEKT